MVLAAHSWLVLIITLVLSIGLTLLLIPLAYRIGWVDQPNVRKVHASVTPLVGGLAVFLALCAAVFLAHSFGSIAQPFTLALLAGCLVILIVGTLDDVNTLPAKTRLLSQALICLLMAYFGAVKLDDFGPLFSSSVFALGWFSIPVTVFAALGVINSFNMIDGMDGLSGTVFLVAASGALLFSYPSGFVATTWVLMAAIAAVTGFLLLNARLPWNTKARSFLGDAGSMMLGFLLAWCLIRLGSGADRAFMPMTAVWLFAVPLLDTSTLIRMRVREGRSAFDADQRHLHHACLRAGFSVEQSWLIITGLAIALALLGIGLEISHLPGYVSFYVFMAVAFTYYFYLKHCWTKQSFLGRHFIHHDFLIEEGYA